MYVSENILQHTFSEIFTDVNNLYWRYASYCNQSYETHIELITYQSGAKKSCVTSTINILLF